MRASAESVERGVEGRLFFALRPRPFGRRASERGWTLIELVITMTVMSVLTLAIIPIVRTSVRRQKEQRLREALREMRNAIDEFHRDTVGMQCGPGGTAVTAPVPVPNPAPNPPGVPGQQGGVFLDPRSRVVIADCTIFGVDNPDRYPPSLEMLVDGVDVLPRQATAAQQFGSVSTANGGATANSAPPTPKKKIYLREVPVDPITGKAEWCLLSNYDPADSGCSGSPNNVFDVRSTAEGEALNGEKYSEW
ncbi:MAG TPA: type II secretion system protein [Pyrinomonadaceae bacterium]|nr:type II secretion system protein [Pyrinomonadaceae bacterium]